MRNFDLKRFRKDFNLKQSDLQELLGVAQSFISKVETGKEAFPMAHYNTLINKYGKEAVDKYSLKENSISIIGDSNIANTGLTGGNVIIDGNSDVSTLKKRIKELEEENQQLKKDKAILQEFVTFLQNKGKE